MASIALSRGYVALVSDRDVEALAKHKWYPSLRRNGCCYAIAKINGKTVYMHRAVMGARDGLTVDHINRDPLDNRRENLRWADRIQQSGNRKPTIRRLPRLLGIVGVQVAEKGTYRACLQGIDAATRGPRRQSEIQAAFDRDRMAVERYGEFAALNFPACHKIGGRSK